MGTRAVTIVEDEDGVYVSLYRQYDGYPEGHGKELAEFLDGAEIGNGITGNPPPGFFNGVGDLAARLVTFFKENHKIIGGFYIIPTGTKWGPDYTYTVTGRNSEVFVKVQSYSDKTLFEGPVGDFRVWVNSEEDEED